MLASKALREDFQHLLSEQQLSIATILANDIDHQLSKRLEDLQTIAGSIHNLQQERVAALQQRLSDLPLLRRQFNGGVFVTRADGTVIIHTPGGADTATDAATAATATLPDRLDSDAVASVLANAQPAIGGPKIFQPAATPAFHMAVPIRDEQGRLIGALSGAIDLSLNNFLDQINHHRYGDTGGYLLVDPRHRYIVSATDKRRVIEPSPMPEDYPDIARFLAGAEGTAIFTNPRGIEVLQSVRQIPGSGWYVAVALPTAEAFAPIHALQQRMLIAALLLSLLAGVLTWWVLRRQLAPIFDTLKTLSTLATEAARQPLQSTLTASGRPEHAAPLLAVSRNDEIGQLIDGFNHVLITLNQRETELAASTERLHTAQRLSHVGSWSYNALTGQANLTAEALAIFELPKNKPLSFSDFIERTHPEDRAPLQASYAQAAQEHTPIEIEHRLLLPDGRIKWVCEHGLLEFDDDGQVQGSIGTVQDITSQKQAETELRIAAVAFESQLGILVTDAHWIIQRVNPAFTQITGYTAQEAIGQSPHIVRCTQHDDAFYEQIWHCVRDEGAWHGEVWQQHKQGHAYPCWLSITAVKNAQGETTHYVGAQQDISDRKYAEERINQLAFFDQLTGLPNRTLLLDRLRQAIAGAQRSRHLGALLFINLDKFKTLNDTLGHDKGDLLLKQTAERLIACVRGGDTVARMGGDEFIIMLPNLSTSPQEAAVQAEAVGEKILAELNRHHVLDDMIFHSTASLGISLFTPDSHCIDDLLKQVDLAMNRAKSSGRNSLRFFDPEMEADVLSRAALESDLHEALSKQQFQVHYQAQMTGGVLSGSEALLRWQHPQRGMIAPDEFIPLAEETGLILQLGAWVLEAACQQLVAWADNPELNYLSIAVNVSPRQFHRPEFVSQVCQILERTGANPRRLKLELTESLLIEDVDEVIRKMQALKEVGLGFALDDFGTGYSSLYYLKHLPFDQMKIDRSFVRDILDDTNDATIARTIVTLAQSLGLGVIAEGVENQAQLDFLAELHCHAYQGYYFSRPLPVGEFEEYALGY